jgi:type IV pilus assembly protein PilC
MNVEVAPSMFSLEEAFPTLFKVKPRDVIVFSRQLATLLRSGISLLPALEILHGQVTASRAFRKILESIIDDLRAGSSFSQAISKHPRAFSDVYCRTVAVGEQSGNLEMVLNRMADYQERQSAVAGKIGRALTYPLMVLGLGVVVVIVLMTVVMPQMLGMFTAMNVELPLPTRILIAITNFFSSYPLYIVIALAVLAALVLWLVKQPTGRRLLDRLRLTAPVIGIPTLMGELARFCRTMSVLVGAGLSLQEIMEMMPQSSNNMVIRDALSRVNDGLLLGEGLSGPMSRIDIFPPLLVQMVAVGEESNSLDFTMGVVADFYEVTSEEKTSTMVGMIAVSYTHLTLPTTPYV